MAPLFCGKRGSDRPTLLLILDYLYFFALKLSLIRHFCRQKIDLSSENLRDPSHFRAGQTVVHKCRDLNAEMEL